MPLRKLSEAIRTQDWFAVIIEVLVVVVGIFLALQVDAWNESRKERALETRYLERLDADIENDIEAMEFGLDLAWDRHEMGQMLLEALDDPTVATNDPTRFVTAIEQAGWTFVPPINDTTFEEIKFSGNLGVISNEDLRQAISGYYKLVERNQQWNYLREANQIAYMQTSTGILSSAQQRKIDFLSGREDPEDFKEAADITAEEARETLEKMSATPEFVAQIVRGTSKSDEIYGLRSWRREARKLREQIAEELGR